MHIIITGTSSGIGKALAERYLSQGFSVTGIGRRHTISHPLYKAIVCDLSDAADVSKLEIGVEDDCLLINNAGSLGNVQRISDQEQPDFSTVMQINALAPVQLMNRFARLCGDRYQLTVVNISSGAARRAIPSWGMYCASKAALEMASEVFYLEEQEKGRKTRVYCISPGVVDTPMQAQIRSVSPEDFSLSTDFHAYKEKGELADPAEVTRKIQVVLEQPYEGFQSIRIQNS